MRLNLECLPETECVFLCKILSLVHIDDDYEVSRALKQENKEWFDMFENM